MRGGQQQEVPGRELLAGDLVVVEAGDILPADGLLVQGGELRWGIGVAAGCTKLYGRAGRWRLGIWLGIWQRGTWLGL